MSQLMRAAPVTWLTVREFGAGRAIRVTALFAATPIVFALIYLAQSNRPSGVNFLGDLFLGFLATIVIPLATLILATAALGNELSDRTIPYLALKPVGRWRIVLEKFAGTVLVTAIPLLIGIVITWGVVASQEASAGGRVLLAMLAATLAGILAYGALFLFISLVIPRALIVGIIYVILWEGLIVSIISGARVLSIRHYVNSIFVRLLDSPAVRLDQSASLGAALVVLALVVIVSLALASRRLSRMSLD
ncbi:MAG TPA: ABC transporter permease subunit [Thermomicrobiaceae bacterium]|nr:ABC transporter permease subunit [Thermomicrobiaceae bacterium]